MGRSSTSFQRKSGLWLLSSTLAIFTLWLGLGDAHAAVFNVSPNGTGCAAQSQNNSLQACLDQALNNNESDTLRLQSGDYVGNFLYGCPFGQTCSTQDSLTLESADPSNPARLLSKVSNNQLNGAVLSVDNDNTSTNLQPTIKISNLLFQSQTTERLIGFFSDVINTHIELTGCQFADFQRNGASISYDAPGYTFKITGNTFVNNANGQFGSGIGIVSSISSSVPNATVDFSNNLLINNSSQFLGGAVSMSLINADVSIANNIFLNNRVLDDSDSKGGGMHLTLPINDDSSVKILHNTFFNNLSTGQGGGISLLFKGANQSIQISNNLVFGNQAAEAFDIYAESETTDEASQSISFNNNLFNDLECISNGTSDCRLENNITGPELSNLTANDLFAEPANPDVTKGLRLKKGSLPIDKGTPEALQIAPVDFAGIARDNTPDIGAFEFQDAPPSDGNPPDDGNPADGSGDPSSSTGGGCTLGAVANPALGQLAWLGLASFGVLLRKRRK